MRRYFPRPTPQPSTQRQDVSRSGHVPDAKPRPPPGSDRRSHRAAGHLEFVAFPTRQRRSRPRRYEKTRIRDLRRALATRSHPPDSRQPGAAPPVASTPDPGRPLLLWHPRDRTSARGPASSSPGRWPCTAPRAFSRSLWAKSTTTAAMEDPSHSAHDHDQTGPQPSRSPPPKYENQVSRHTLAFMNAAACNGLLAGLRHSLFLGRAGGLGL